MVTRVYGKLDGVDIVLYLENGKWVVSVPVDVDGMYIFELIAEDTAGNTTFLTKLLFVVNKAIITTYLIPLNYQGTVVNMYSVHMPPDVFTAELGCGFNACCLDSPYSAKVLS